MSQCHRHQQQPIASEFIGIGIELNKNKIEKGFVTKAAVITSIGYQKAVHLNIKQTNNKQKSINLNTFIIKQVIPIIAHGSNIEYQIICIHYTDSI